MYKETILDNGLRIITHEDKSLSIIDIRLIFRAGSRYEEKHQKGYAHILEHMLLKGTAKRPSPLLLAQEIDDKGGYKNAHTGRESFSIVLQAANNYAEEMFELLSDMLLHSLIDPVILENEKKVIVEELKKADDNIESFFTRFTFEKLFSGHPLATNILGDPESITSASNNELKTYKEKFLVPDHSALVVSGNISHNETIILVRKYFSEWSEKSNDLPTTRFTPAILGHHFYYKNAKQTLIAYNLFTIPADKTRELAALDIIQNFLNFGGSSALKEELRHKRGLVYSISLNNYTFSDAGFFSIKTSTSKPKETVEVIKNIIHNLKNLFTEDLLSGIKMRHIGYFKLNTANPYSHAGFLSAGFIARGKLFTPEEYISEVESVSYNEIIQVIDTYLVPEKAIITTMGQEDFS